jgi:hypothetical protein
VLSVSSLAATGNKIELIFDNKNLTNWITLNSTYTKDSSLINGRYLANTTGNFFTTNVTGIGTIYGEWVQIKFPKRRVINDVLFIPESLPRAIIRGYLLGSNNGITWNVAYGEFNVSTWTNFTERSLLGVYAQNTKQFIFYRLVSTQIQGVTSGGFNDTEKFAIAGLRFTYNEYVIYSDSIFCIGNPITGCTGDPTGDCILDVNGDTNIQGTVKINGNVGIGTTTPTNRLHIVNSSTSGNPDTGSISLYVYNPTNSAGQNSVIINRVAGSTSGRVVCGFDINAVYGYSIKMDANNSALKFNYNWEGVGTDTMVINNNGNVGIANTNPTGTLCLGTSQVGGSDGFLLIGKNNGGGGVRTQRIGYNSNFDLTIGDYGGGTGPWIEAVKFSYASPANALVVSGVGYTGIGIFPSYRCHVRCSYADVAQSLHLDTQDSGDPNKYALTIYPYVIGGGQVGWRFRTQSYSDTVEIILFK